MSKTATGTIEVHEWAPQPYDEADGASTLVAIDVRERFSGDIEADGVARLLQVLAADGSASFIGHERVTGSLDGRSGSFVLQDVGTLETDGTVHGEWIVVPGSGTGELTGLTGSGGFEAALGAHAQITLTYDLP